MKFGRYTFECSFLTHASLPEYKAAIFRDYFGYALKQAVCVLKSRTCNDCLLRPDCLYATVFESNQGADSPYTESPHPFVIEPPETRLLRFSPNDAFSFHLLLFGDTIVKLPYFVLAATLMGEKGFGRRAGGHFVINSARCGETVIYSGTDQMLHQPPVTDLICSMTTDTDLSSGQLHVQFLTPLRLKHDNREVLGTYVKIYVSFQGDF
ncbi:MAG: CRISPR-associated protein Cas6, partial [Desulfobacterales bacterium]